MFDIPIDDLDAAGAVQAAAALRRSSDAAEARLLEVAAHVADLHPVGDGDAAGHVVAGMERLVPLAGEGTPEVAEFAPAELGAALGITTAAAGSLIGDALELRHRLPRVWRRLCALEVPSWRARLLARETMSLSVDAADFVDRQVAHVAHSLTTHRVAKVVEAAILQFDPERAAREAAAAADGRGVLVSRGQRAGVVHIGIDCDETDARAFDETVEAVAQTLGRLGDGERRQVRRAKAIGILADPQEALDLLGSSAPGSDGRAAAAGSRTLVHLHVHLSESAVRATEGVARVEGVGPVCLDVVRRWLGRADIKVHPVLHLGDQVSVDAYEIPDAMREAEIASSPFCVFPWCNRDARDCDIDHTTPFADPCEGGPPGQTTASNLGPLCRRHHRIKTHGSWRMEQADTGVYLWISPHGWRYRVDHLGTTLLGAAA